MPITFFFSPMHYWIETVEVSSDIGNPLLVSTEKKKRMVLLLFTFTTLIDGNHNLYDLSSRLSIRSRIYVFLVIGTHHRMDMFKKMEFYRCLTGVCRQIKKLFKVLIRLSNAHVYT